MFTTKQKYKNPNYQSEWREKNRERLKQSRKNYYEKNKEQLCKKYKEKYNDPATKERKKSYYQQNKAKILAAAKVKYAEKKAAAEAEKENVPPPTES
tara:strand:- start:12 stop:302 length:291 start_codon:yes stop_codon:yes gene_type:complete